MHKERVEMSGRDHHSNSLVSLATDTASFEDSRLPLSGLDCLHDFIQCTVGDRERPFQT